MIVPEAHLQLVLDLVGVFVFALSGGLVAVRRHLDLFGVVVLAAAAGLGGGVLRDLAIGAVPPTGMTDWRLGCAAVVGGIVTFWAHPVIRGRITLVIRLLDAAGLAAFTVTGALKALDHGTAGFTAVIVGTVTAIGGGMIRDVLAGQVPEVLQRELYAIPAVLGATLVVLAHRQGWLSVWVALACAALVLVVRVLAVLLDLNAPRPLRVGKVPPDEPDPKA